MVKNDLVPWECGFNSWVCTEKSCPLDSAEEMNTKVNRLGNIDARCPLSMESKRILFQILRQAQLL